jgi:hypothetical protein
LSLLLNNLLFLWLDQALSLDPRILKFKQEEKAAKEAKKKEKEAAAKRAEEEMRKVLLIRRFLLYYFLALFSFKIGSINTCITG